MASSKWRHGFCDCCGDCRECCCAMCCPCITMGHVAEKVGHSCVLYGLSLFVPILGNICLCTLRGDVRHKHNIEGSAVSDCCATWFCGCCALIQMSRQVTGDEPAIVITTQVQESNTIVRQP